MLRNYTTYGTAAHTGNLNSALAISLLDLALICSIILRKFCDLFFMPSYFEKYHFPVPCAQNRVVIEEPMSDLVPVCVESRERGKCLPKSLSWLLRSLNAFQIAHGGMGRACLYMNV